jgi:1,4-dihydroxy-6-naphthoate synthase
MNLTLAFSPCPNDCFIFDAIVNRRIDLEGLEFSVRLADVEALNKAAFAGDVDVTKLSFHAYAYCADAYVLLDAGSALGNNCGPLLISKRPIGADEVAGGRLRIAIPANTRPRISCSGSRFRAHDKTELRVLGDRAGGARTQYDAGLIIHENRFTYQAKGLKKIIDLGEFWEQETGAPIPLGGIVIRRALPDCGEGRGQSRAAAQRRVRLRASRASLPFVREHAQEMSEDVMYKHIDLYVNDYSIDLGADGRRAVELLFERAACGRT